LIKVALGGAVERAGARVEWIVDGVRTMGELPFAVVLVVAWLLAFAESGLGLGTLLPGEAVVVVLGASAAEPVRFAVMLAVVALGVSAGDHVGYGIGRRYGVRLGRTRVVRRLGERHWDRAMAASHRHGATVVFLTRLVPVVRTLAPAAAGASRVPYVRFLPASLAGALLWSAWYVGLGAFAGASVARLERLFDAAGWALVAAGVAVAVAVVVVRRRRASARLLSAAPAEAEQAVSDEPQHGQPDQRDHRGEDGQQAHAQGEGVLDGADHGGARAEGAGVDDGADGGLGEVDEEGDGDAERPADPRVVPHERGGVGAGGGLGGGEDGAAGGGADEGLHDVVDGVDDGDLVEDDLGGQQQGEHGQHRPVGEPGELGGQPHQVGVAVEEADDQGGDEGVQARRGRQAQTGQHGEHRSRIPQSRSLSVPYGE
jgi:membrane protein DedA with SNARE-associated domain